MAITTNKNFLSPVGFQLKLDSTKYENVEYFCTSVSLPDLSIAESPTPFRGSNMAMGGDRLNFGNLEVTFNITENMENYIEIYNWLNDIVSKVRYGNGDFVSKVKKALSSKMFKGSNVKFSNDKIAFNASSTNSTAKVVPIFIEMNHQ